MKKQKEKRLDSVMRKARKDAHITLKEMEKKIDVTRKTIAEYEKDITKTPVKVLIRYCEVCGITLKELIPYFPKRKLDEKQKNILKIAKPKRPNKNTLDSEKQNPIENTFYRSMQKAREDALITQATMADIDNITRETIARYENGSLGIYIDTLTLYSIVCGISLEELISNFPKYELSGEKKNKSNDQNV